MSTAAVSVKNLERLITQFAQLSEPGKGVTRLAYSPLERQAHELFANEMTALGLTVKVDAVGNSIAELEPTKLTMRGAIGTGSHLDSVPSGGRFDGVAGVCAGIEAARVAVESGVSRSRPWRFLAFAAEEGARFGQACTGSRVMAGLTSADDLRNFHDKNGVRIAEAMADVGLSPERSLSARLEPAEWDAFIELHVEQGNVLETLGLSIGVVDCISGSSRLLITVSGTASHTGGTPMHLRRDALTASAECVLIGEQIATDSKHRGTRVTVGRLDVSPDSITTIPGVVVFTVDIRDLDSQRQRDTAEELLRRFSCVAEGRGVTMTAEVIGDTSPAVLPTWIVDTIIGSAKKSGLPYRVMPSGASHDAQQMSRVTPTGMIFIPSKNGLSHVPEEWTSYSDLAEGTLVLLEALTALDQSYGRGRPESALVGPFVPTSIDSQ